MFLLNEIVKLVKSWLLFGTNLNNKNIKLQILVTNTVATVGCICLIIFANILDIFTSNIFFNLCIIFSFFFIIIPLINKFGFVNLSRYYTVILGNTLVLVLTIFFNHLLNFSMLFLLLVLIIFLIFKYNEIKKIIFSLIISFISIGIYEIDYWLISERFFHLNISNKQIYFINNILFITLIIAISIFITMFIIYIQKSEDQLRQFNKELKERTSNLIQAEKFSALGELTAGISHELNQPLNVINIISQAVLKDIEKERFTADNMKNDMCEINVQVQRMSEIIEHMKIFTRSSVGYPKERLNINIILDGVMNFFREQLKGNKIEIYVELFRNIPYILGDSLRLEHLFINLITNARDAVENNDKGMKIIKIKTDHINKKGEDYILFQIYDNGNGIDGQLINKIFQPFFTTKEPGKGTGLGLAIVNKIVEDHKGKIELKSEKGKGTTFYVYLPVENSFR